MKKIKEILEIFRWRFFIWLLVFFGAGLKFYNVKYKLDIVVLLVFIILVQFFGFSINNFYDFKGDKLNKKRKKGALRRIAIKNKKYIFYSGFLCLFFLSLFFLIFDIKIFYSGLGILFIMFFYSMPPLRFKEIPFIDFISNIVLVLLFIFLGAYYTGTETISWQLYGFSLLGGITHLGGTILDYKEDKKSGFNTTCVFLGKKKTFFLCILIILFLLFLDYSFFPRFVFLIILLFMVLFYNHEKWFIENSEIFFWFFIILYLIWFIFL